MKSKSLLKRYGIKGPGLKSDGIIFWAIACLFIVLGLYLYYLIFVRILQTSADTTNSLKQIKPTEILTIFIALAVAIIGLMQWRIVRRETSLEKYYDRREIANRRLENIVSYHALDKDPYKKLQKTTLTVFDTWVYSEVDLLEYTLEKYKLGHLSADYTCRAVRNFKVYCKNDPTFNTRAKDFAGNEIYQRTTKGVVETIYNEVKRESSNKS